MKDVSLPYFFGVSIPGPDHPCQDANAYESITGNFGVIAVSDGLGHASRSDIGAKLTVDTAIKCIKSEISSKVSDDNINDNINLEYIVKDTILKIRKELEDKAIEHKCSLDDLACTAIIVAIYKNDISIAHIGDGAVVIKNNEGLLLKSEPEEKEYINEVTSLASDEWEKALRINSATDVEYIVAFTDGCERAFLNKVQNKFFPYDRFFEPLISYIRDADDITKCEQDIKDFLSSEKMNNVSEDDKTVVISLLK